MAIFFIPRENKFRQELLGTFLIGNILYSDKNIQIDKRS